MKDKFLQHLEKHVSYTVSDERYFDVLTQVDRLVKKGNPAVIAIDVVIMLVLSRMNVEETNEKMKAQPPNAAQ